MSELTTEMVRIGHVTSAESDAKFKRWIAKVQADALRDAASATVAHVTIGQKGERTKTERPVLSRDVRNYLESRADVIEASARQERGNRGPDD